MDLTNEFDENELKLLNANHLPLKKLKWEFSRGERLAQKYVDENGNVNIIEEYTYTHSSDLRGVVDFTREMKWIKDDGTVIVTKDTTPDKDYLEIDEINESIRIRRIRYLKTAAKALRAGGESLPEVVDQPTVDSLVSQGLIHPNYNTVTLYGLFRQGLLDAADGVDNILTHYRSEIIAYEKDGTMDFENAVSNETDPVILATLNSTLRPPDATFPNGLTGRQSINYQLTGIIP